MSTRPSRMDTPGRVFLDLRRKARAEARATSELLQLYALEGFLDRLAHSKYANRLVLKGGALLAAYDLRRATRDLDFQAKRVANDPAIILSLVREVATVRRDDGLAFEPHTATSAAIREGDAYQGVRVKLPCTLASARVGFGVDVNVGDPIWPGPQALVVPRLLGGTVTVAGYPLPMVYAEKIVTMLQRGTANTRWRDFADIYLLSGAHPVAAAAVRRAMTEVASYRKAPLVSLSETLADLAAIAQRRWAAWSRTQGLAAKLPSSFVEVLAAVTAFAEPLLSDKVSSGTWAPKLRRWR
jgi:hypothetical protein